jgi:ribosome-associated heat shock protein Hsp15
VDRARVDQWLWSIRLFKTRRASTDACRAGHVKVNGVPARPSTNVVPGDRVTARVAGRDRVLEVVRAVSKRVSAAEAAACLIDLSPPPPSREEAVLKREPGSGRPTKRDRRQMDRLRG